MKTIRRLLGIRRLIGIEFTAYLPTGDLHKTCFKVGPGPCGKTVSKLKVSESYTCLWVTQYTTDGEKKTFRYNKASITGRYVSTFE